MCVGCINFATAAIGKTDVLGLNQFIVLIVCLNTNTRMDIENNL